MSPIKVLIADDQTILRSSLASLFDVEDDFEVVGEASNGKEVLEVARCSKPDVVLMDIRMPEVDGLTATQYICEDPALEKTKVLILTMFDSDEYIYKALCSGASGFLLKDSTPKQLLYAIRQVFEGQSLLSPKLVKKLIKHYLATPTVRVRYDEQLTNREVEVLTLVGRGLTNREIASHLVISLSTVKSHISNLRMKLEARDRVQLVITAYEYNLVTVA